MSKTSKFISGIIALIAIAMIGSLYLKKSPESSSLKEENKPAAIKVGVVGHFSGKYADYGIPMKKSVELAVEEHNKTSNNKIELIAEDDNSDSNNAASAINKLINVDKINYIISAQGSGVTSAIAPIVRDNNKILMITLASSPGLTKIGDSIFRSVPSDSYQGTKISELINGDLKSNKIAGLYTNDAYGNGIKEIIEKNKDRIPVISEMFESGAADFRSQLLKIKDNGADTLIIVAHNESPAILKQVQELGLNIKIIASETFKDENILKECGETANGVMVTFPKDPQDYASYNNKYFSKFNEKPSAYGMYAYDGAIALIKALSESGDNLEKIKADLGKISFDGASGKVGFDETGDRTGSEYAVYIVENGEFREK